MAFSGIVTMGIGPESSIRTFILLGLTAAGLPSVTRSLSVSVDAETTATLGLLAETTEALTIDADTTNPLTLNAETTESPTLDSPRAITITV